MCHSCDPETYQFLRAPILIRKADGTVETIAGDVVAVDAESVCVHGDTPGAVAIAAAARTALAEAGVRVASFV